MIRKIIMVLGVLLLLWLLSKAFLKLFEWDIELLSSTHEWVKIVDVEEVEVEINIAVNGRGSANLGSYRNWVATVNAHNVSTKVRVNFSPVPEVGQCLPVTVKEFTGGVVIALLDIDEWRLGVVRGGCEN